MSSSYCRALCCVVLLWVCGCAESGEISLAPILPWKLGTCLTPGVKEYFTAERFFKGAWYEQRSFGNYLLQADGICSTMKSKVSPNGLISVINYHYEPLIKKYVSVRGTGHTQDIVSNLARVPITYTVAGGLVPIELPVEIVETDYKNWALLYSCKQHLIYKAEMSWILTRERGSERFDGEIRSAVARAGINFNDYVPQQSTGCGPDEPQI